MSAVVSALRVAVVERDRGALAIQKRSRGIRGRAEAVRQRHLILRHFYAGHLQRTFRGFTGRKEAKEKRRVQFALQIDGARRMQKLWRGHAVRMDVAEQRERLRAAQEERKKGGASLTIQRLFRGHRGRELYRRVHYDATALWAAVEIQRLWRGKVGRDGARMRRRIDRRAERKKLTGQIFHLKATGNAAAGSMPGSPQVGVGGVGGGAGGGRGTFGPPPSIAPPPAPPGHAALSGMARMQNNNAPVAAALARAKAINKAPRGAATGAGAGGSQTARGGPSGQSGRRLQPPPPPVPHPGLVKPDPRSGAQTNRGGLNDTTPYSFQQHSQRGGAVAVKKGPASAVAAPAGGSAAADSVAPLGGRYSVLPPITPPLGVRR
jgi:hypothetical protein